MKILLVDLSPKAKNRYMPSLALLKFSTFYKKMGHQIFWANAGDAPKEKFDKILISSIFLSELRKDISYINLYSDKYKNSEIIVGGPSVSLRKDIFISKTKVKIFEGLFEEIENVKPDYDIANCNYSFGFTTRGCCNKCPWCVVPITEGKPRIIKDWQNTIDLRHKLVSFMDNNVLACGEEHFESVLKWCSDRDIYFEFNQAMDAHLFSQNENFAKILSKYKKNINLLVFAWDGKRQNKSVPITVDLLEKYNLRGKKDQNLWYLLYGSKDSPRDVWERAIFLLDRKQKIKPMRFKDIETGSYSSNWFGFDQNFANFCAKVSVSGILDRTSNRKFLLNDFEKFIKFVLGINLFRDHSLKCMNPKDIEKLYEQYANKVPQKLVDRILNIK